MVVVALYGYTYELVVAPLDEGDLYFGAMVKAALGVPEIVCRRKGSDSHLKRFGSEYRAWVGL